LEHFIDNREDGFFIFFIQLFYELDTFYHRFIEELLGQTRFKDWLWTGGISSNFPTVDYAREVA